MKRWLYAYRYVSGEPQILEKTFVRRTAELLRTATGVEPDTPAADGSFAIELDTELAGVELAKRVRVRLGVAYHAANRVVLPIAWHAQPARHVFPAFEGALELEPLDESTSQLSVTGTYRTPLGVIGGIADAAGLHRAAAATAELLLHGLGRALAAAVIAPSAPVAAPRYGDRLRVADVMTYDPVVIDEDMPLRTAALLLFHNRISGAPVVNAGGELIGVLSERDLLVKEATERYGLSRRAVDEGRRRMAERAGEACTSPALTTSPDSLLADVAREMLDRDVSRFVVVDGGRVAGIVTRHDVLAALLRDDAALERAVQHILDDEDAPDVRATVQWGEVTLGGSAALRSAAEQIVTRIEAVDGVMVVRADGLTWDQDDARPPMPYV